MPTPMDAEAAMNSDLKSFRLGADSAARSHSSQRAIEPPAAEINGTKTLT